jgi:hypothetical protein
MAFVNEAVPEEQKSKFDSKIFFNPFSFNEPIRPFRWTIDRERDVFLIYLGGGGRSRRDPNYLRLAGRATSSSLMVFKRQRVVAVKKVLLLIGMSLMCVSRPSWKSNA